MKIINNLISTDGVDEFVKIFISKLVTDISRTTWEPRALALLGPAKTPH